MNILLTVSYDGTKYYGWQRQNNFVTVQQKLEESLSLLLKKDICVRGASRTDTGVHALGQAVLFKADTTIPINNIPFAVNSFLPDDIVVTYAEEVSDDFHPQYSVTKKTYQYKILNDKFKNPMLINYTDFVSKELNIQKMKEACFYFMGTHDFKAFCASGSTSKTTVRTIYELSVKKIDNLIYITVTGNGFLYNMVRIIVGTLISVGLGKIEPRQISDIINSKDRSKAGKTVLPNGLTLMKIFY